MVAWARVVNSEAYRRGTIAERRMLELRVSVGVTVKALRRRLEITQAELARRIGSAQPTISQLERGSPKVSLDLGVRALLALDASDAIVALAFDLPNSRAVQKMRERADLPLFTRPRAHAWRDPVLAVETPQGANPTVNQDYPYSGRRRRRRGSLHES